MLLGLVYKTNRTTGFHHSFVILWPALCLSCWSCTETGALLHCGGDLLCVTFKRVAKLHRVSVFTCRHVCHSTLRKQEKMFGVVNMSVIGVTGSWIISEDNCVFGLKGSVLENGWILDGAVTLNPPRTKLGLRAGGTVRIKELIWWS